MRSVWDEDLSPLSALGGEALTEAMAVSVHLARVQRIDVAIVGDYEL